MKISPCCISSAAHHIATNFRTCHDSTDIVPCTKFCSDHFVRIEVRMKQNSHRIWILDGKTVTETGPWVDPFYLYIIMRRTQSETFGPDASLTEGISIQVLIRLEYLFVYIISSVKSFVTKLCRPKDSITVSGSTGSSIWLNQLPFIF